MARVNVVFDDKNLGRLCASPAARQGVREATAKVAGTANALAAGYRTGYFHRDHKSPAVGGTQAAYGSDVQDRANASVGIVHPANYAAMKDNHENNTLLKAVKSNAV